MYCECGEEAIVSVGHDKVPLCLEHFNDYLRQTRKVVDQILEHSRNSEPTF